MTQPMPLDFSAPQYAGITLPSGAPAAPVIAAQLAAGQVTQAVSSYISALPTVTQPGQAIGIAVPLGTVGATQLLDLGKAFNDCIAAGGTMRDCNCKVYGIC